MNKYLYKIFERKKKYKSAIEIGKYNACYFDVNKTK